jgi:hypothetical protein
LQRGKIALDVVMPFGGKRPRKRLDRDVDAVERDDVRSQRATLTRATD